MTIEYVLLMIMGGLIFAKALISAPKVAFEKGGTRLAARVETQIATGSGFRPYPGGGDANAIPWVRRDQ